MTNHGKENHCKVRRTLNRPETVQKSMRRSHIRVEDAITEFQRTFAVPGRSLVNELIEERRQAAAHE